MFARTFRHGLRSNNSTSIRSFSSRVDGNTLILNRKECASLLSMDMAVPAVENAFRLFGEGKAQMPAKVYLEGLGDKGDLRAMPAFLGTQYAGVKWVNSHPNNPSNFGLPCVLGTYIISDAATGHPLAILDGTELTAFRTGAAAAVGSKHLAAKKQEYTIGFIGTGVQSYHILNAHKNAIPSAEFKIKCIDIDEAASKAFAAATGGEISSLEEVVACDIVNTTTPGRAPIVKADWIQEGSHFNAIGADAEGKQEFFSDALRKCDVFVDDMGQATHSGEVNVPIHDGVISESDISGGIGDVVAGTHKGRTSDNQVTMFDSTGLAIQDLSLASMLYEVALEKGVGLRIPLVTV